MNDQQNIISFLDELNELTAKHRIYVSNVLDEEGNISPNPYLIPLNSETLNAGYTVKTSGELIFDWY